MNLNSRLSRIEAAQAIDNPSEALTEEELDAAIEAINQSLANAIGSPSAHMVDIPVDMDEQQLRALVAHIKGGRHG